MDGWSAIAAERITAILEELTQVDDRDGGRLFDSWIPAVPAADGEVMLHITGNVIAADIIQLDQQCVIRQPEPIRTSQTAIPKIKHGQMIGEYQIDLLDRLDRNLATTGDRRAFDNYVVRSLNRLLAGVRDRRELLYSAMLCDDLDYNRFGIIMSNVTWGMPATLKVTAGIAWSNPATATPISDLEALLQAGEDTYGEQYDTVVMTRQGFDEMAATDEFIERSQAWFQLQFATGTFPTGNRNAMSQLAENILSSPGRRVMIQVYNKRTYLEAGDGALSTAQFLPDDKVILADSRDFGSAEPWDFANADVIETKRGMVPSLIGEEFAESIPGPVAYATAGDPNGDPPGQVLYAVQRGWPRKHRQSANAVLTI